MTTAKALLLGGRRRLALTMVGGFAGVVALALAVAIVADLADIRTAAALTDRLVPLLVFYAPAPIAAAGGYARCGGPACLTVGVVPALVFATLVVVGTVFGVPGVGGGDAPLGGVTMSFALVGLSGAFVGYCAGVTAALLADLAGIGGGSDGDGVDD
ncbi:hypothetical protein [Halorubrum lipolyticum]|uniref:Uncharacterized protein n=1 Tax=Halorubrum lipolyticum DSM 21995 TaxID=1227482 RepID=M0NVA8_9EURY|nr:hypothetical protein [Halorubrum lipolyticum]EMA61746.1 hypothetical protein C469_06139 [Halorubrum lipolyticum DSM 21995]